MIDGRKTARRARLTYVSDKTPGVRRRRAGSGFVYLDRRGHRVASRSTLLRIRSLAVPPAWTDVWICPTSTGHLQEPGATPEDASSIATTTSGRPFATG